MNTTHALPERPLPEITTDSRPYWDGLLAHELRLQRCTRCATVRHYPRPVCDRCYALDCDWIIASGRGQIHSWTVAHHPFHLAFKALVPYTIVTVDLDEGVRMAAPLVDSAERKLVLAERVQIVYIDLDATLTIPGFQRSA